MSRFWSLLLKAGIEHLLMNLATPLESVDITVWNHTFSANKFGVTEG